MNLILAAATAAVFSNAPTTPVEVQIPFGCGHSFPVSQTHNTGSHVQNDTWAWDFRMPEGTPITAAQDGVVRMARGDSTIGGCDPKMAKHANYVVVKHQGGIETQYLHFSSVVVKPGDRVKAGDLLGYSGSTGWACGAHLHFKVAKTVRNGWNNPSIRAALAGYGHPEVETVVAAPACRAPEVKVASSGSETEAGNVTLASSDSPSQVVPAVAAPGAASLPEAVIDAASSDPEASIPPPVGTAPTANGGSGAKRNVLRR